MTDGLWTGEIDGESELHTPGPEDIRDTRELVEVLRSEQIQVCIHIVHVAAIDPDGPQQARVLTGAGQVLTDMPAVEADRPASIPALDAAIEVVPLVSPAD